jgi:hypothetical protein
VGLLFLLKKKKKLFHTISYLKIFNAALGFD